jgi:integrase
MAVYSKKKKDGTSTWFYDFMHNGVRYRGTGGVNKTQATRTMEKIRREVLNGEYELERKINNPRFEVYVKIYLADRKHMRSQKRDELSARTLLAFFKGKTLQEIKPPLIKKYMSHRRTKGVAPATVNRELACLKKIFTEAIESEDARENPVKKVKYYEEPPGRTRFLTEEEGQTLIECADDHLKPIIMTALHTGMRLGEILSLKWKQVFIDSVIEPYIELMKTKNNKKRYIPLTDDMVYMLEELKKKNGHSDSVFLSTRGLELKSVKFPFSKVIKKVGISDFRFHDLRHTFASHYVMNGGDLLALKEILGHSSIKMVERYSHLAAAYKRKQINNLSGKFTIHRLFATFEKKVEKV